MNNQPNITENIMNGLVVCVIGQFDARETRQLAAAAKSGLIHKARAPFAGRFGSLKTYFAASPDAFERYQSAQVAKFDLYAIMDDHNRRSRAA